MRGQCDGSGGKGCRGVSAAVAQLSCLYIYSCYEYNLNANGAMLQSSITETESVSLCFNNNGRVAFKFSSIQG